MDQDAVRAALPVLSQGGYLNTGTAGPLPAPAVTALQQALQGELEGGRIRSKAWEDHAVLDQGLRAALARLLATAPERIALTHHSTEGLNIAALGLPWEPGDAVITTDLEHAAVQVVVGGLRLRHAVEVRVAPLASLGRSAEIVRAVADLLRDGRVRALFLSHVSYANGVVLPLRELAEAAHARGAAVVVDGAQAVGALPVRPTELGVDMYALSGQKWLCGPEGTGALWIAPGWEERLRPGVLGYASVREVDTAGFYLPRPGARRLEVGTVFHPALAAWHASLLWLEQTGWPEIWERTHALAERVRRGLRSLDGVEVLTPEEHAGLVSFRLEGRPAEAVVGALRAQGLHVRSIPGWNAVRASLGFFLTEEEADGLVHAVQELRQG